MDDNKVLRFIENQKKEKEAALNKILHLEEKLQAKQKLEFEMEELMKEVEGEVSQHLRQNGELRPTIGIIEDEIDATNQDLNKWQRKYDETSRSLARLMEEKQRLELTHNEEIMKLQRASRECTKMFLDETELMQRDLDSWGRDLDRWSKELSRRESLNELERRKLEEEKDKSQMEKSELEKASMEQKNVLRLIESQKREKEAAWKKIILLEKELDEKQKLELEIVELKGKLQVMQHMGASDEQKLQVQMQKMDEDIKDKMDEIEDLETLNLTLLAKERKCNDEMQDARKVLIEGLKDMLSARTGIIIKRMGELDQKPFHKACEEKISAKEASLKAAELCTLWQEHLRKPEWHPFKIVVEGDNAKALHVSRKAFTAVKV